MSNLLGNINAPEDLRKLTADDLPQLAEEIRQEIIRVVGTCGGHLGSNLGVVELTLALHYVFDFSKDAITWDVSNQTYTHKLLTGRKERFNTLRQLDGISGFANREESAFDAFTAGHAGTAVSTALGILCGDEISARNRKVIAVVGDGAMTCGMSFEALNHCGAAKKNLLVILNDNAMSISRTVGALSKYLNNLRTVPLYEEFKTEVHNVLTRMPVVGHPIEEVLESIRRSIKATIGNNIFSAFGFQYYGPIDGHDVKLLIKTLKNIRKLTRPILLHVLTQKGHGHPDAAKDPLALHGISPKSRETKVEIRKPTKPYTKVFAETAIKLAEENRRVVAVTAAMPEGTGLVEFERRFPERSFDVGICEQHAVGLAAGLAHSGLRPIAAIYSTFLQRAYDQVFHEVCLQKLPVLFAMDRAGVVGPDGPTHNGVYDIAYLRTLPGIVLMAPRDGRELEEMMRFGLTLDLPSAIRYPRCNIPDGEEMSVRRTPIELGKAEIVATGVDGAILAYGSMVAPAIDASAILARDGMHVAVVNARFAKPVDGETIKRLIAEQPFVLTLEEHALSGGFGSAVTESALASGLSTIRLTCRALPDKFLEQGDRDALLKRYQLDAESVAGLCRALARHPEARADRAQDIVQSATGAQANSKHRD